MKHVLNFIPVVAGLVMAVTAAGQPQRGRPIAEGHLVAGVEGRVVYDPNDSQWAFIPKELITDGKGLLSAGESVALLTCSVLEQMAQLAGEQKTMDVRLWAMATEYRGQNFLFSLYFLPLKEAEKDLSKPTAPDSIESKDADQTEKKPKESILPSEIMAMMKDQRTPDLRRLDELVVVSTDRNLIHRTGLIERRGDEMVFTPDAFGQNVAKESYRLLPCQTLLAVERQMQRTLGRSRYVISGVITEYEGQMYLLPRRAVRTYSHGNFTP